MSTFVNFNDCPYSFYCRFAISKNFMRSQNRAFTESTFAFSDLRSGQTLISKRKDLIVESFRPIS